MRFPASADMARVYVSCRVESCNKVGVCVYYGVFLNTSQYLSDFMSTKGERLKFERERLGLTQATIAEIGGIQKRAQINYENNSRNPDAAYLECVAKIGVDVLYVITGVRTGEPEPLARDEAALLDNYRHSSEEGKRAIRATGDSLAQSTSKVASRKKVA